MAPRTLSFRLIASSIIWVTAFLLATGVLLTLLFRAHIEQRFDARLRSHLEDLVAASTLTPDGTLELIWTPSDPRYNRPLSGWYWQIGRQGRIAAQSNSAWHHRFVADVTADETGAHVKEFLGPEARLLRGLVVSIFLPRTSDPLLFVVAGPVDNIERAVAQFSFQLGLTLGVLGLGLVTAVLVQVRFGLRPLRAMQAALSDIRAGRSERLPQTFPAEVQPVAQELNALLDHKTAVLERYRTQTANLAHALKNPLTVLSNEIRDIGGAKGALLKEQTEIISKQIDRHLLRARVAASRGLLGARTPVAAAVEDIRFSMLRLYRERELDIVVSDMAGLFFKGDAEDLEEMLGNLIENACKWARHRVAVEAERSNECVRITIEDDGPGIPLERREEVLKHGRRLDSRVPGSGLGLGIAKDVAELYGGSLTLSKSNLGGLSVELELPAAE